MEQGQFLEQNVFSGLEKQKSGKEEESNPFFSEADFETILKRTAHYGIAVYGLAALHNGELFGKFNHEEFRKKATDAKWYKKAFLTFKKRQSEMLYGATYKVSSKLLAR